jgi:putative transposase
VELAPHRCNAGPPGCSATRTTAVQERFRLDFLPFVERTVQAYGISIDGIHYYSDVLRRFVGATENERRRVFVFRRDPRDISTVSFWDPELQRVFNDPVPQHDAPADQRLGAARTARQVA